MEAQAADKISQRSEEMNNQQGQFPGRSKGHFLTDFFKKFRLVFLLMQDPRVAVWIKAIPVFCLVYLIVPTDFLFGPIDDAVVIYFGMDLFLSLCPPEVVKEYQGQEEGKTTPAAHDTEDVVDVKFKE